MCPYKEIGVFPDCDFLVEDFYLLSKGEPTEVGIDFQSDLGKKLFEDMEANDHEELGRLILHSHNNMSVSPSSTDLSQVVKWASGVPYCLSLIINNKIEMTALIALAEEKQITTKSRKKIGFNTFTEPVVNEETITEHTVNYLDIEFPKFVTDVLERYKVIQNYSSLPPNRTVIYGTSPTNQTKVRDYNWDDSHYPYQDSGVIPGNTMPTWKPKQLTKQAVKSSPIKIEKKDPFEESGYISNSDVRNALYTYCFRKPNSAEDPFTVEEASENIVLDLKSYGIPINRYLEFIGSVGFYHKKSDNTKLIAAIKSIK
jgi:hypothetical protein